MMEEILHQLIGSFSHDLQGFIHPRWCRISSINSMMPLKVPTTFFLGSFQGRRDCYGVNVRLYQLATLML